MAIKALPTDKTFTGGDMVVLFNDFYFQQASCFKLKHDKDSPK